MQRRHLILTVAAVLLAGIGSYAACGMEVSDSADELDLTQPDPAGDVTGPGMERPITVDAGTDPLADDLAGDPAADLEGEDPQTQDTQGEQAMDRCGGVTCGEGETCCRADGACYPSDCPDCCLNQETLPVPGVEMNPEPGDPAGPPPGPGPVPSGDPPQPGSGTGPGPMPPGPGE
ncbi:MAG TPA: hypothetical protein RMH99_30290 [Sandaracinaceae bacterium LLY-WYZ-13_1]|nr:hypothetical protein [Sandaracinaceae bacterium LLY-WYZ-13_1]